MAGRSASRHDLERLLPLKPLVFEILLALAGGERHGWTIVRALQERLPGARILPGHFYRTLRRMLDDGLIEDAAPGSGGKRHASDERPSARAGRPEPVEARRRYFRLTALGEAAASAEARRLEALVAESRAKHLLSRSRT